MKDDSLSQQFALIALNGMEMKHVSMAKAAAMRGIAAAKLLEACCPEDVDLQADGLKAFEEKLDAGLKSLEKMKKEDFRRMESEVAGALRQEGVLDDVQDLLGCDMFYETSGIEIRTYRTDGDTYTGLVEQIRAEILENGPVPEDIVFLVWLLRETGCLYDVFSSEEQVRLNERMVELAAGNRLYRMIWQKEFRNGLERFAGNFLRAKKNLFKNPYLEGVNLLFPFIERRKAIFIDFVVLGTNVQSRRMAVMAYLSERGHFVEAVPYGTETLLKIDNNYYRIFPMTKVIYKVPVQGANLVPVYW